MIEGGNAQDKYREAFEQSPVAKCFTRLSGEIEVNQAFLDMLGYTHEEIRERGTWQQLTHPDDVAVSQAAAASLLSGERSISRFEKRYIRKDGSIVWVEMIIRLHRNTEDDPDCFITTILDITERRQAQEDLRASEAQKAAILNGISTNIALVDADLRILWANQAAALSSDMQPQEMVGQPCYAFWGDSLQPCAECPTVMAFQTAQPQRKIVHTPDGRVWDEGGEPILDGQGNVVAVVEIAEDITERTAAQDALRESEEKYRRIAENINDVVWILDAQTLKFSYVSPSVERLQGFTPDEIVGSSIDLVVSGPDRQAIADLVAEILADLDSGKEVSRVYTRELQQPRKDGSTVWTEVAAYVGINDQTGLPELRGVSRDVSERVEASGALQVSEARYRNLWDSLDAGVVVHAPDTSILMSNATASRLLGLSDDQMRGKTAIDPAWAFLDESGIQIPVSDYPVSRIIATGEELKNLPLGINRPDMDEPVWAMVNGRPVFDQAGQLTEVLISFIDISERKAAELKLVEEQTRSLEQLQRSLSSIVEVVSRVVETRDPYTAGHELRVSELAVSIAHDMGMAPRDIEDIRIAALVHDVGKISVPAEILSKPGTLSPLEFQLIKNHPESGFEILSSADMDVAITEMVHQHHERCDGSGYPQGLGEEETLVGAKVLAVADVVEAMVSHRPYRPGLGVEVALAEIEQGAGTLYDARVSESCLRVFGDAGFEFTEG